MTITIFEDGNQTEFILGHTGPIPRAGDEFHLPGRTLKVDDVKWHTKPDNQGNLSIDRVDLWLT